MASSRRDALRFGAVGATSAGLAAAGAQHAAAEPAGGRDSWFDVTRFGARGDGRTIDSPAINRAVDAAARRGGTVYFPPGTYASYSVRLKSDVNVHNADPRYPSMIFGLPGHDVEDVRISNVRVHMRGGLSMTEAAEQPSELINTFFAQPGAREPYAVPDRPQAYPEPSMFGILPAWAFYLRHATGVRLDNVSAHFEEPDTRPAVVLDDVRDAEFHHVRLAKAEGAPTFVLRDVTDFALSQSRPVAEARLPGHVDHQEF